MIWCTFLKKMFMLFCKKNLLFVSAILKIHAIVIKKYIQLMEKDQYYIVIWGPTPVLFLW